jgi:hypothetical protein
VQPLGQYPHPIHTVAHISDTHLLAGGKLQYGVVDTVGHLAMALDRLGRVDPAPQALVFTGDLADRGEPEAYRQLRAMVEPVAERMRAQVVWCMGNHDHRDEYARGLFEAESAPEVFDRVCDVDGLRIVSLDTSEPGYHHGEIDDARYAHGEIDDAQYAWLAEVSGGVERHSQARPIRHQRSRSPACRPEVSSGDPQSLPANSRARPTSGRRASRRAESPRPSPRRPCQPSLARCEPCRMQAPGALAQQRPGQPGATQGEHRVDNHLVPGKHLVPEHVAAALTVRAWRGHTSIRG